jgi:hypothetical protein
VEVDKSGWRWGLPEFFTLSELRDPECRYLSTDGTLKMRIRFVQFGEIVECKKGKDEELVGLKERAGGKILQNVGALLDSQDLSDLKIKTSDGKLFQAHKLILGGWVCIFSIIILKLIDIVSFNNSSAAMSPVFLAMFKSDMVETGEGVLAVEDMSGESMEQLLKHIYTGSVDKLNDLKVEIVLELLNATNKVEFKEYLEQVLANGFDHPLSTNLLHL